jgi:hypothetical protein
VNVPRRSLLLVSRAIIGSVPPRGVYGAAREDRGTPGGPGVRPEASDGVLGWSSSALEGPRLARDDLDQSRVGGWGQVGSYRDRTCGKWRRAPVNVHLPIDVTRLRDKPTQPTLHCLSARLLCNHGIFLGKSCPSLGPALALAARRSNLWDLPHGKDFLPADVCDTSGVYHHRT